MVEFRHNTYELTVADLTVKTFPFSKVFQMKYGDNKYIFSKIKSKVTSLLRPLQKQQLDQIDQIEINLVILSIWELKKEMKELYPSAFNKKGWYDTKVWRESPGNEKKLLKHELDKQKRLHFMEEEVAYRSGEISKMEKAKRERGELLLKTVQELGKTEFSLEDIKVFVKDAKVKEIQMLLCRYVEKVREPGKVRFRLKEEPTSL